ncbi:hypothetical protein OG264_32155 [Streptomyces xanthophaeus]|uniref:hypothetical protein n=1 Tax=Streptomyces xanthophaeus TaxID=67385 RepID=UPI003870C999|nr:hypothetical protein OG264_32155 [Streptomyces xanthophaeus]WST59263.1 hypothetical protein OG605_06285 [Streptomyces xanthophaeus]
MSTGDGAAPARVDGLPAGTVKAVHTGAYTPRHRYRTVDHLTPGSHTVTVTQTGGTCLQLGSVTVIP